jgi:hypothetical protein
LTPGQRGWRCEQDCQTGNKNRSFSPHHCRFSFA